MDGRDEKGRQYKRGRKQQEMEIEKSREKHCSNQESNL